MNKYKVLMVTPYFYPKTGGTENYALQIAQGLKKTYAWEIVVVTANHIANGEQKVSYKGITIYRLPISYKISNTPVGLHWKNQIDTIIEKEQPDVINGHTPVPFISDIAARVAKKRNIPFVLTYQNDLVKNNPILQFIINNYYFFMGNTTGKIATKIIVSSAYYPTVSPYLKQFANKLSVISPGVAIPFFDKTIPTRNLYNRYKNKKIVLFVGQLDKTHRHKGLHILMKAMREIITTDTTCHLVVIGKGDMIDEYTSLATAVGIHNNIEIITDANNQKLVNYYKLSDVVVLPSINKSEGFGMVLIEANACKKPVIGSRIGGIPYVIQDNKTGLLVNPGDVTDLTKALKKILSNPSLAQKLGENGYKRVLKEFTWDQQVTKTHTLFRSLL